MLRQTLQLLLACAAPVAAAEVLTQHNDNARTGANLAETALTPATVNAASFGKLFTLSLNASVNGQVLYMSGLEIGGSRRNVVFAYTSNNVNSSPCGIFAFDADAPGEPLWRRDLPPGAQYTTDTPAIDAATRTMYLVSKDKNDTGANWLHAIDVLTGAERAGSPVQIAGSVEGAGAGSVDGRIAFPASHGNCRPGVLVEKGLVYVAFSFNTDRHPYHGWVFCYAYDGGALVQRGVLCTTPDPDAGKPANYSRDGGGIWQAGKGLASDGEAVYCTTGNGSLTADSGGRNYAMCFLKLRTGSLEVLDWFAESKARKDSDADNDLGNCGPLLIPGTAVLFAGAAKYGRSHLVDAAKMGHFVEERDACLQTIDTPCPPFPNGQNAVAWRAGDAGTFIYLWNPAQPVAQYRYDPQQRTLVGGAPFKVGAATKGGGGGLAVTADGTAGGILWCLGTDGVVHALDATDVGKELWNSGQDAARDALGKAGKWQFPTVAGGKAYIPTGDGKLVVYGLLKP
jgi:hypothetical protein